MHENDSTQAATLHYYEGECDSVIATSPEDADAVYVEQSGYPLPSGHAWKERTGTIKVLDDNEKIVDAEVSDVIAKYGRGHLATTAW